MWKVLSRQASSIRGIQLVMAVAMHGYCGEYFANTSTVGRCTAPTRMIRWPFASRKSAVVLAKPAVPARKPDRASFFSTIVVEVVISALAARTRSGAATAYVLARSASPLMSALMTGSLGLICLK